LQKLQVEKEFKIIVSSQYAALIIHNRDLPKASIVWLPENYRHTSFSNNLGYYRHTSFPNNLGYYDAVIDK
jgi:hypothetical protein